jgi:hypothetical protein
VLKVGACRFGQFSRPVISIDLVSKLTELLAEQLRDLGLDVELSSGQSSFDIVFAVPSAAGEMTVAVDVKGRSQPLGPAEANRWLRSHQSPTVLALPHINRSQGQRYRAAGLNYIDASGNAYLDFPGFRVEIEGRRPVVALDSLRTTTNSSMGPAGLKVLFVLLVDATAANAPYERIAQLAQVSKGSVTNAIHDLRRRGHIYREGGQRRLVDRSRLADDWVDGYAREVLPRLKTLSIHGPSPQWWNKDGNQPEGSLLSGGMALAHFGAPLAPDHVVVFGVPPWRTIRQRARLTNDGNPNITLRQQFWSTTLTPRSRYVPSLLAYAEALASDDPREVDAGRALWRDAADALDRA